jgi:hypothetical protein
VGERRSPRRDRSRPTSRASIYRDKLAARRLTRDGRGRARRAARAIRDAAAAQRALRIARRRHQGVLRRRVEGELVDTRVRGIVEYEPTELV